MGQKETKTSMTRTSTEMWLYHGLYPDSVYTWGWQVPWVNKVTHGDNIPFWKERIARGESATTGLMGERYTARQRKVTYLGYLSPDQGGPLDFKGIGFPYPPQFPAVEVAASSQARTKAVVAFDKNFRSKTSSWSGGVFFGELVETARFLSNPVRGLYGLTRKLANNVGSFKRLANVRPKDYANALSDTWLAYQFAAKPLANDANDAAKALRSLASGRTFDVIKISGTGTHEEDEGWYDQEVGFQTLPGYCRRTSNIKSKSSVRIRGAWKMSHPGELPVPMQFGVSVLDVLPTAWELIPWSFLVDYFTNVGDVLSAYNLRFVNWAWLNQTIRNSRTVQDYDWRSDASDGGWQLSVEGGRSVSTSTWVLREPAGADDLSLSFHLEIPATDSKKWLNIAALTNSILASKP